MKCCVLIIKTWWIKRKPSKTHKLTNIRILHSKINKTMQKKKMKKWYKLDKSLQIYNVITILWWCKRLWCTKIKMSRRPPPNRNLDKNIKSMNILKRMRTWLKITAKSKCQNTNPSEAWAPTARASTLRANRSHTHNFHNSLFLTKLHTRENTYTRQAIWTLRSKGLILDHLIIKVSLQIKAVAVSWFAIRQIQSHLWQSRCNRYHRLKLSKLKTAHKSW